jgi:hypothetical protein
MRESKLAGYSRSRDQSWGALRQIQSDWLVSNVR